ncbi:hypothetical protein OSTOST_21902 [Ostertagia ostertagi]
MELLQYTMLDSSTSDISVHPFCGSATYYPCPLHPFQADSSNGMPFHAIASLPRPSLPMMQRKTLLRRYVIRRRTQQTKATCGCTLLTLLQIQVSIECSQSTSIIANEHVSALSRTRRSYYDQATIIALQPLQQKTYLANKRLQKRAFGHAVQSHHRCYLAGSCTQKFCDNVKPTDTLEEISSIANKSPGYTYCTPTCGCLTCGGCLLCEDSCIFYQLGTLCKRGHHPELKQYNVKKIAAYSGECQLVEQLATYSNQHHHTKTTNTRLYVHVRWKQHRHNQTRLTRSSKFRRLFASETCKCTKGFLKMSCIYPDGNLKKLMEPSPLPLTRKNFLLTQHADTVLANSMWDRLSSYR